MNMFLATLVCVIAVTYAASIDNGEKSGLPCNKELVGATYPSTLSKKIFYECTGSGIHLRLCAAKKEFNTACEKCVKDVQTCDVKPPGSGSGSESNESDSEDSDSAEPEPEKPVTVPEEPVPEPEQPVTEPEEPVPEPEQPVTEPEEPVPELETEEPLPETEEPVPEPETEEPIPEPEESEETDAPEGSGEEPEIEPTEEPEIETTEVPEPEPTEEPEIETTEVPEPEPTAVPEPEPTVAPEPETTAGPVVPTCPEIKCTGPWNEQEYYVDPSDCGAFWQCSNGTPYRHECPGILEFNSAINVCDWPQAANCEEVC